MIDGKSIIYLLPAISAVLWGLNFSIYGHLFKTLNVPTLFLYLGATYIVLALAVSCVGDAKISLLAPFETWSLGLLFCTVLLLGGTAWMITLNVVQQVSPTYAAIGEVAYPVFVPIFSYLIFRRNEFDVATIAGGFLIMLGLFIMIYFKSKATS